MINLKNSVSQEEIDAISALSDNARADLAAQINATDPFSLFDNVEGKEGKEIVCPVCGSGSGKNNTGIKPKLDNGVWLYHCFAGNDFEGDLIKIIADVNNLSTRGKDFFEVLAIAAKVLGIPVSSCAGETPKKKIVAQVKAKTTDDLKQEQAAAEYIKKSRPKLKEFLDSQGGFWRGLGYDVLNFLLWGFCANCKHPSNNFVFDAVIIPNDNGGLLARQVDGDNKSNIAPTGTTTIYLPDTDTFDLIIVEGAINGASILQAVPAPTFGIMASGGTSGNKNVLTRLQQLSNEGKKFRVLIAFDNDTNNAGQNAADKLLKMLIKAGYTACTVDITKTADIDLNDVLRGDNGELKLAEMVNDAVALAQVALDKAADEIKQDTGFNNAPINLPLPPNFKIQGGKLLYGARIISHTPLLVTTKFWQGDKVFYELAFSVDGQWKKTTVPATSLFDKNKLVALSDSGIDANTLNAKNLCAYLVNLIGINAEKIPVETLYAQGGWTDNSCTEFIYPNDKKVFGNNFDYPAAFAVSGDKEKFKAVLFEALQESYTACLVVGVALAAPLIKILSISNKQLHLGCRSGNGKTAIVKLALAIFGNPKYLMLKFNATANALENFSVVLNDFPSGIDELQSINKFQRDCIDELLYNYENGQIRSRLTRQGTFQPIKYFRGCRITTGEQPLTNEFSNEGAKKRCVEISENNILREEIAVKIHSLTDKNFGFFGRDWTEYVKNHAAEISADYDSVHKDFYKRNPRAFQEHISLVAVAQVALKHFCNLVFNALEAQQIFKVFEVEKIFAQLSIRQEMQNGKRAIAAVAELYLSHTKYFLRVEADGGITAEEHAPNEFYGYVLKNGDIAIFPKYLKDWLKDFPNFQAILRDFSELKYLDKGKDKKRLYQKAFKINQKPVWGYVFKAAALFEDSATCERKPHEETIEDTDEFSVPVNDSYSFDED